MRFCSLFPPFFLRPLGSPGATFFRERERRGGREKSRGEKGGLTEERKGWEERQRPGRLPSQIHQPAEPIKATGILRLRRVTAPRSKPLDWCSCPLPPPDRVMACRSRGGSWLTTCRLGDLCAMRDPASATPAWTWPRGNRGRPGRSRARSSLPYLY